MYSYEADFIQTLLSMGEKQLSSRFNLTYSYIDDVLSINKPEFENYLGQMYPAELENKDTRESTTSACYLDLLPSIGRDCLLHTSLLNLSRLRTFEFRTSLGTSLFLPSTTNEMILGIHFQVFQLLSLAKDHWQEFSTMCIWSISLI